MALAKILYIYYPFCLQKDNKNRLQVVIDSGSKINTMTPVHVLKLGVKFCHTNVEAQKINDSIFNTFRIVLANFQIENKFGKAQFFQIIFPLAKNGIKAIFEMLFLTFNNADI